MRLTRSIVSLASTLSLACTGGTGTAAFHGTVYVPPTVAPSLQLVTAFAAPFDLARVTADSGRAALVFFGYTHCPDVCPTTLATWARVARRLGRDADRVRFVFVTVDPARDSGTVLARYVARFHAGIVGLSGSPAALAAARRAWGAPAYDRSTAGMPMSHLSRTFLVDPAGDLRVSYSTETPAADVADDLRRLLQE